MAFIYKTLVFKVIIIRITTTGHNVTPYMAASDFLTILIMPDAPLRTWVNSPLARVARFVLGGNARVAMVIGRTVHLSGATRAEFLAEPEWVAHEKRGMKPGGSCKPKSQAKPEQAPAGQLVLTQILTAKASAYRPALLLVLVQRQLGSQAHVLNQVAQAHQSQPERLPAQWSMARTAQVSTRSVQGVEHVLYELQAELAGSAGRVNSRLVALPFRLARQAAGSCVRAGPPGPPRWAGPRP